MTKYVIVKPTSSGIIQMLAKKGYSTTYTTNIKNAKKFSTYENALHACRGIEKPVAVEDLIGE